MKSIHYITEYGLKHNRTYCGVVTSDYKYQGIGGASNLTQKKSDVTCKKCLKSMKLNLHN